MKLLKGKIIKTEDKDLSINNTDIKIYTKLKNPKNITSSNVASIIKKQIKERINIKKILQNCLKKTSKEKIKGIKIQIAGRLNGNEIARKEWLKYGQIPLQTLKKNIDYSSKNAYVIKIKNKYIYILLIYLKKKH